MGAVDRPAVFCFLSRSLVHSTFGLHRPLAHFFTCTLALCSAQKDVEKIMAGVTVGVGAMMVHPLVAEAAVTPSLKNLLNSLVAGGVVLGSIAVAISAVSNFDQIRK